LSEDLIGAIQQLLILGKGDQGRLEYLLDSLQKGRPLPDSDQTYLKMMIPVYLTSQDPESYKKNVEATLEKMHEQIKQLDDRLQSKNKGFEKYVGRKAVLFFVTVFIGWNAFQSYIQPILSDYIKTEIVQYLFPLNLAANYVNYGQVVWFGFLVLMISWPFIGAIHLAKFIKSRKISN
jgi:hypothetical protein